MRSIGAVVGGLLAGLVLMMGIQYVSHLLYPLPSGVDPADPNAMREAMAAMPFAAFLLVLVSYFFATAVGSWIACRVARGVIPGVVVGVLFLLAGIANLLMIPHPLWFWPAALIVFAIGTFLGTRLGSPMLPAARTAT